MIHTMKPGVDTVVDAAETLRKRGHKVQFMPGPSGDRHLVDGYQYTSAEVIFLVQNNLKPGTEIWRRVALHHEPDLEATGLTSAVARAYQAEEMPEGVDVYRAPASGGIVYYFSPQASAFIPRGTEFTLCVKPELTSLRKVQF